MDENLEGQNPKPASSTPFESPENQSPYNNPQTSYTETPPRRRSPKKFLYILGAVVALLVIINLVRLIGSKEKPASSPTPVPVIIETPTPEPVEKPTPEPSATPKPATSSIDKTTGLDRAKLSVSVQNGSGGAGVGAKMADLLKSLGYNVTSTGNADNFDYTNVTIKVKLAQKEYLPVLNKDITSNNYSVGTTSSDLTATSSADALVIVGK